MSVYMIGAIDIHDPDGYELYRANVPSCLAPYLSEVEFLSGDDNPLVLEGEQPANHLFINKFSSLEVLKEFYYSEAYQNVKHYRFDSATTRFIIAMAGRDEPIGDATLPAYMFSGLEINDMDKYGIYREHAGKAIAAVPELKVLSSDDYPLVLEGTQPANHLVLAGFASVEGAKAFYDSELYQVAASYRRKASDARFFMIMRGHARKTS